MVAVAKSGSRAVPPSPSEIERRRNEVRQAVASVVIEGGQVSPEMEGWLEELAMGRMSEEELSENLRQLHGLAR